MSLLENSNLTQHVSFPTHQHGHILDLVITTKDSTLLPSITHSLISPSDHFPIFTSLCISPPTPPLTEHFFRCINSINMNKFIHDIHTSILISHPPNNLHDLVDCYNKTLSDLLNKHASLKSKLFRPKPSNPWLSPTLAKLKTTRRHLEKIWSSSHSLLDLKLLRSATNHYHAAIIKAKKLYNSSLISSNLHNPRKLWHTINHLLHRIAAPSLPSSDNLSSLPQSFATFFPIRSTNFAPRFQLVPLHRRRIFLPLSNHLIYHFSNLQLLMKSPTSYLIHLTHLAILTLFQPHCSKTAMQRGRP